MSKSDTARQYYSNMRDEINLHIRLRDQSLFLFLGAVGAIFGIAYSKTGVSNIDILLVTPFIALGAAFLVTQHDSICATIAFYCNNELDDALKSDDEWITPWDKSESMKNYQGRLIVTRVWAHLLIIEIPVLFSLAANHKHLFSAFPLGIAWWFGLLASVTSIYLIVEASRYRKSLYDKYPS